MGDHRAIDINDYIKEELLKKEIFLVRAMLIEKVKEDDKLIEILDKIVPMTKEDEKADMIDILRYILVKDLRKERAQKYIDMLEGGRNMGKQIGKGQQQKNAKEQGKAEEIDIGKAEGRTDTVFQAVKEMLKNKVKDTDIMKYMHITKEELEELKLQMV